MSRLRIFDDHAPDTLLLATSDRADIASELAKIGVGFELSRLPTIQPQSFDVPMDFIVTEAGVGYRLREL